LIGDLFKAVCIVGRYQLFCPTHLQIFTALDESQIYLDSHKTGLVQLNPTVSYHRVL